MKRLAINNEYQVGINSKNLPAGWKGSGPVAPACAGYFVHPGSRSSTPYRTRRPPTVNNKKYVRMRW